MTNKYLFNHLLELRREGLLNRLGLVRYSEKEFKFRFNGWIVQSSPLNSGSSDSSIVLITDYNGKGISAGDVFNWVTAQRYKDGSPRITFEGSDFQQNEIYGYIDQDSFSRVLYLPHGGMLRPVILAAITTFKTENPIRIKMSVHWQNNYIQLDTRI